MRILVLGDSYSPAASLRSAFEHLEAAHDIDYADLEDEPQWQPATESERRLREYLGSPRQVIERLDAHEVLVVQGAPISAAVLDAAPLRLVCVTRGGPVNVDVQAAAERGIPVVVTPGKNATAVAELTITLMVILARRLGEAMRHIGSGAPFGHDNYEGVDWFGHELAGQRLGLVGFGHIGRRVAVRARAFEMDVLVHDPFVDARTIASSGARAATLDELLGAAHHVSLHTRLTSDNRGMFDASHFGSMRAGATFINTARSELVDEDALHEALCSGHLGGVALDVVSPSPATGRHRLLDHPNVVILPHLGGATYETLSNGGRMAASEVDRLARGMKLEHVVRASRPSAQAPVR